MKRTWMSNVVVATLLTTTIVPYSPIYGVATASEAKINKNLMIKHQAISTADAKKELSITADFKGDVPLQKMTLLYKAQKGAEAWSEKPMQLKEGQYHTSLAPYELQENFTYMISATDGEIIEETVPQDVTVELPKYESKHLPPLLLTEVVPDSTNVDGSDGYEFIEVYNNSNQTIDLKDYKIHYRYPTKGPKADLFWGDENENRNLPLAPGETMIYWIMNGKNNHKKLADFNKNYDSNVDENHLVRVYHSGMTNSEYRQLTISTNANEDIVIASYNEKLTNNTQDPTEINDVAKDMGIQYQYPEEGLVMRKHSAKTVKGNPGKVSDFQVPTEKVDLSGDTKAPVVKDISGLTEVTDQKDIQLKFDIQDERQLRSARLYYRMNDGNYHSVNLKRGADGYFSHTIYAVDLIQKEKVEYYIAATDGFNPIQTSTRTIINQLPKEKEGLSLNVENQSLLSKEVLLKAFHSKDNEPTTLSFDGQDVTTKVERVLPNQAYFALDVNQTNLYFKNAVTIGREVLRIYDDTINEYATITVPVDPSYFNLGETTTISIHAGDKVSPFGEAGENRDDYTVKNIRLVMPDGEILRDEKYTDPKREIKVGDSSGMEPDVDFNFTIPKSQFSGKAYRLDTTAVKDGEHVFEAKNNKDNEKATVLVDNTSPIITTSLNEGELYKGLITIDAEIEDANIGTEVPEATLDGEKITLPYDTSSAKLKSGEHQLIIKATDAVGNVATKKINFNTVEEHPFSPENLSHELRGKSAKLSVEVADPTKDRLRVDFKRGYVYKPTDEGVEAFEHNADKEPPETITTAQEKTIENVETLAKADGQYITTKSTEKYPYHRFSVNLDRNITAEDSIDIHWEGKSLLGRKVSIYVWNYETSKWEIKQWKIANDEKNFPLNATVKGNEYIRNHQLEVMVQDEIASTNQFDYSFVWMSDTQYYSQSYPQIFDTMTKWIVNNRQAMNIRYVFHTGDLVDKSYEPYQWLNADKFMNTLDDADMPYGVLAGNHDVNHKDEDYSEYSRFFGAARFEDNASYGESYKDNRGHYDLISEKGQDFIMLYMGWGITQEDIAWMNKILAKYPERKAILNFHEYLLVSGQRSPIGNDIFEEVVKPNKNVLAVLSGHYHDAETLTDVIDDDGDGKPDRRVHQMLADYQGGPEGGQGYMRLMQMNPINNQIQMKTYSPYLDKYNFYDPTEYPAKDEFVIDADIAPKEKEVSTDAISVEVYTNDSIGHVDDVKSGETANVLWDKLEMKSTYSWYAVVRDEFEGTTRSPLWTFTTPKDNGKHNGNKKK